MTKDGPSAGQMEPWLTSLHHRMFNITSCICRFFAVWDDRDSENGQLRTYIICYYLSDDTVEVQEVYKKNEGRDPFPLLLHKMKLPRDWKYVPGGAEMTDI
jgi:hypothetical protein